MGDWVLYPEKLTVYLLLGEKIESQQLREIKMMAHGYQVLLIVDEHHMLIYMFLGGDLLFCLKKRDEAEYENNESERSSSRVSKRSRKAIKHKTDY